MFRDVLREILVHLPFHASSMQYYRIHVASSSSLRYRFHHQLAAKAKLMPLHLTYQLAVKAVVDDDIFAFDATLHL